ncbi:MAG: hypothetical protein LBN30_02980 [Oscillospiraceae bacterium]|jgi:hypothetical protein|nr:hypothetical protein [Oscillospiraceae bacterium]
MKKRDYQKFDERQLAVRYRVFARMCMMMLGLLFACMFVEGGLELEVAPHWLMYLLIATISFAAGGIELLLRGAYFEKNGMGWGVPYLLLAVALLSFVMNVIEFARGDAFAANGMLTEDGTFFLLSLMWIAFGTVGVVKSRQLRKVEPDEFEDESDE